MNRFAVLVGALSLALLGGCGDPDSFGTRSQGSVGYSLVFVAKWQGPLDLDLEVVTPSGEAINFYNPTGDGCAFVNAEGGRPGPLAESVACTSLQHGVYQARVRNLDSAAVPTTLEISSDGVTLQSAAFSVAAESVSEFYSITVP